jgi:hypothetical protein
MGTPTAEERTGGAARVELYRGPTGHITRFPRYDDPMLLLYLLTYLLAYRVVLGDQVQRPGAAAAHASRPMW